MCAGGVRYGHHRPANKTLFNIHCPNYIKWIFQLRVGLSPLKAHKKHHNFNDTPDDTCSCSLDAETSHHFLLRCPFFAVPRRDLLQIVNPILMVNEVPVADDINLVQTLLYGHDKIKFEDNQKILKATIDFVRKTSRFS